ncbi:hypothetical protein ACTXT7_004677 [Hymenolepis weldensis]
MGSTGFFIADILKDTEQFEDEESNSSTSTEATSWSAKSKLLDFPLPAWIFCTRYSDRPSSGEYRLTADYLIPLYCLPVDYLFSYQVKPMGKHPNMGTLS